MMMEQSTITEHDCNVLGGLFQIIINDLKNGSPTWDDFILKATKFQAHLKSTISASTAFLDSFQKIADMATTTRGGTKEIGTALTRLCLRQRSVEAKLKSFSSAFLDCLIMPLQERVEEWKKATIALDKERTKELKRLRQEFKKRQFCDSLSTSGSIRGHKKHSSRSFSKSKFDFFDSLNSKGIYGTIGVIGHHHKSTSSLTRSLDSEMECNERLLMLEDLEKKAVRRALIEERSHFCLLVKFLRPLIEEEISMISEISHIQEVMDSLQKLTVDPFDLPMSSETVISNLKLNKNDTSLASWNLHTPPSSPSSLGSRKSSMCSISSYNSSSSNSAANYIHQHHQTPNHQTQSKYFSSTDPLTSTVYGSNVSYSDNNLQKVVDNENLQFQIDSISSSNNSEKNTIKITSTNPFLSSYNQIQNKNDDQESFYDKNTSISSSSNQTYLLPSHESDGSITPTNIDLQKSLIFTTNSGDHSQNSSIYKSEEKIYQKSNKPPPAPPVRRTSSLSNPNAITLGTLKNDKNNFNNDDKRHDDNNDDGSGIVKNSSLYDEINVLTKSMNDINFTLKNTDFTNISSCGMAKQSMDKQSDKTLNEDKNYQSQQSNPYSERDKNDYKIVKKIFENYNQQQSIHSSSSVFKSIDSDDGSQLPLPAPPPEAFSVAESTIATTMITSSTNNNNHYQSQQHHHPHYNKITNVNREFLETLNTKLSQSPLVYQNNAKISKRRNSSNRSIPDENISSGYSGKHRHSHRSQSASRSSSRKNSIEKNNGFTVSSSLNNESFVDKLTQTLLHKQHHQQQQQQQHNVAKTMNEIAKAAASSALQRKQSVPELNSTEQYNPSFKNQNRVTFSSSLNLSTSNNSGSNNQPFQVVEIQTNSTQQPIYSSRTQLQREINNLYGTLGQHSEIYNDNSGSSGHQRSSSYYHQQNGFFNKL